MANDIRKYSVVEQGNLGLGQAGAKFISDTLEHTGTFVAIHCLCWFPFLQRFHFPRFLLV